jgi:hypothetical protein
MSQNENPSDGWWLNYPLYRCGSHQQNDDAERLLIDAAQQQFKSERTVAMGR